MRTAIALATLILLAAFVFSRPALPQEYPNCRGFIPHTCCCASSFCRTVKGDAVKFDGKDWRASATGAVVENVYDSEDGDMILCDGNGGGRAYCLFIPPNS